MSASLEDVLISRNIPYRKNVLTASLSTFAIGGVCPFGVLPSVAVYLDESLKRFDTVYPAAGTSSSAVRLSIEELELSSGAACWVDVTALIPPKVI